MSCYANDICPVPSTGTAQQTFSSALQFFAAAQCLVTDDWPPDANVNNFEKFDFIIVGAGTSGCVVANRLSEVKCWNVLIIDVGDDPPAESIIPGLDKSVFGTKYDWKYLTTNDGRSNQANVNGSIVWPRGKMLGGCSNINGMIYIKGNSNDYQRWYNAGNKDWHPKVVQKYFKKAENLQEKKLLEHPEVSKEYGKDGPLNIDQFNSTYRDITEEVMSSWDEIGFKRVVDLNTANVLGSGISTVTATKGLRQSSVKAYLNPVQKRTNLKVLKNALVTEVLIDRITKKAYGVKVEKNGKTMIFFATLEVILSAGTINTPQLLMLSGVGPKKHLQSKNITVKVDLPMVGQNLQDHCIIPVTIYGNGPTEPDLSTKSFESIKYLYNRTGTLAQNSFTDILAFYSTSKNATYPDFQNHLSIFWKNSSRIRSAFSNQFRYKDSVANSVVELNEKFLLFDFMFNLLHPCSKGNISLQSSNPKDHPLIYPNYFKDSRDLDAAAEGIRMLTRIVDTKYFKSINAFLGRLKWPPCDKLELNSIDYWKCVCINMVLTVFHPVGTSKMGPSPKTAVVDSKLRVHKVSNLRVIDASIMPTITSGNTNGPATMIGERGADLVKQCYLSSSCV